MLLRIVHYGDPVLIEKGKPVTEFNADLAQLGRDMVETMHAAQGIGLAAQQIGRALQFCVVDLRAADPDDFDWLLDGRRPPMDLFMPMMIANPQITVRPSAKESYEEGCLSFPEIRGDVVRPDEIEVSFQDELGTPHTLVCNGLLSRCVQHETDHLNGVLFIDRMSRRVRSSVESAVGALAKETRRRAAAAQS